MKYIGGWIKLHREIKDHWVRQSPLYFTWWIDLLLESGHRKSKILWGGAVIELEAGEYATSESKLAAKWGVGRDKVRAFLGLLEKDGMITLKKSNSRTRPTIITINNYRHYQGLENTGNSKPTQSQHITNTIPTHQPQVEGENIPRSSAENATGYNPGNNADLRGVFDGISTHQPPINPHITNTSATHELQEAEQESPETSTGRVDKSQQNQGFADPLRIKNKEQRNKKKEKTKNTCSELSACADPPSESEAVITLPLNDKSEYPILEAQIEEWAELYPSVDVMQQLRGMRGWLLANPSKRKTKKGILRFANSWLARVQDKGESIVPKHVIKSQRGEIHGANRSKSPFAETRSNENTEGERLNQLARKQGFIDIGDTEVDY